MAKEYILLEGSLHEKFLSMRTKIQFMGGGFANGKTSGAVIKALQIAMDYPGANILMARSTYPKLNDTLRKTFIEFCPEEWIASFPRSKNSDNTCTLINGTTINFRYIAQRSSTEDGGTTSNLLSATYDLVVVDQIEDPEIVHKDFLDLLGRLRGSTVYRGADPSMPRTGPRWMIITSNPTRNWVYKYLVQPYHRYLKTGMVDDNLLCDRERDSSKPILTEDGKPKLMLGLVEGSTYENAHVLEGDFIQTLESSYRGQMRDRFLKGEWAAYEGLVYPDFNAGIHVIPHQRILQYLGDEVRRGAKLNVIEGYDHGIQKPSCYLFSYVDTKGNIFVIDGFYEAEASIEWQAKRIREIRHLNGASRLQFIMADPSIFRRSAQAGKLVGKAITDMFFDEDSSLQFARGNNDIQNGIRKVRSYIACHAPHVHPITGEPDCPYLYVSDSMTWLEEEFTSYYWKVDTHGERSDIPTDRNDHALDALKYMLSNAPEPAQIMRNALTVPAYMHQWIERDPEEYAA
jgi:hypothetical protein